VGGSLSIVLLPWQKSSFLFWTMELEGHNPGVCLFMIATAHGAAGTKRRYLP